MLRRTLAAVSFLSLAACTPLAGLDDGNAQVELGRDGEEPLLLTYDPLLSSINVTPPVDGVVELTFDYQDPLVQLTLRVDASQLSEGEQVVLPVAEDQLFLSVLYDDAEFISSAEGASGTVDLQVLSVDESSADILADFDVTLPSADPGSAETLSVSGFVEGAYGDPSVGDEGADADAGVDDGVDG